MTDEAKKPFTLPKPSPTPRRIRNYHYTLASLSVAGVKNVEIAKELHISPQTVSSLLNTPEIIELCHKIRFQLFGKDIKKRIEHIVPKAIDVAEKIMLDEMVKPSVRKDIASDFMDRHLGKATQTIDVQSSSIRELILAMKERDAKKVIDSNVLGHKDQAVDAEFSELPIEDSGKPADDKDDIQRWVDENLKNE